MGFTTIITIASGKVPIHTDHSIKITFTVFSCECWSFLVFMKRYSVTYPLVWHVKRMKSTKHVGKIPFDPQVESGCLALMSTLKIDTDFGDYLHLNFFRWKTAFLSGFSFPLSSSSSSSIFSLFVQTTQRKHTTGRCGQSWDYFSQHYLPSFIYYRLIHTHPIIMSSSRLLIHHQTVTLGYQSIASGCVVSGFARETSVQTKPQQCQRKTHTHTHTHTHTTSIRKSPNQKKKEQKKEVKHRRSPYCPQTPALHPSLPSAPLLCLQRSDQRAKRKEEKKKRRRRRSGQERRSQRYEKLQGESMKERKEKKRRRRRRRRKRSRRRCARSGGPKNQKVTQNQKLLLLLLVMYE